MYFPNFELCRFQCVYFFVKNYIRLSTSFFYTSRLTASKGGILMQTFELELYFFYLFSYYYYYFFGLLRLLTWIKLTKETYLHISFHRNQNDNHSGIQLVHLYMFPHSDNKLSYTRWWLRFKQWQNQHIKKTHTT